MKLPIKVLILVVILITCLNVTAQNMGDIEINVNGLRNKSGQIIVTVHTSPEGFPKTKMYRKLFFTNITVPNHTIILEDIPFGDVAISLLHDENNSGKMDYNFLHLPKEGFAFYTNFKVTIRAPSFNEVAFQFNQRKLTVRTEMQY